MRRDHAGDGSSRPRHRVIHSIRAKLVLCFGAVFVAVIVALQWVHVMGLPLTSYSGEREQEKAEAFRGLNVIADLKKDHLVQTLSELRNNAHAFAASDPVQSNASLLRAAFGRFSSEGKKGEELRALLRKEESYRSLRDLMGIIQTAHRRHQGIFIADATTQTVLVSTNETDVGSDASRELALVGALRSRDDFVAGFRMDMSSGRPALCVSHVIGNAGVKGPEGEGDQVVALLAMEFDSDGILRPVLHAGRGLGLTGETLLVDQDAKILSPLRHSLPGGVVAKPLEHTIKRLPAALSAGGQEGTVEAEDYRNEPVLAAYRHIGLSPGSGWGLVVKRDRSEIMAPLRQQIRYSIYIGLAGLVVALAVTVAMARGFARPILALDQSARRLARGELDARAPIISSDEIGRVAGTFNEMARKIQQRSEELTAANSELEAFAYSVSHDLRTPLRAIDGFSQVLLEDYAGSLDEEGKECLNRVRKASQRMGHLIDDLLRLSRLTQATMRRQPVNLSQMAREIAATLQQQQPDRRVEFVVAENLIVRGDRTLLQAAMENLLDNAWKFTAKRPAARIEFGAVTQGGQKVYFVRDNGVGFDMAYADKLFGAFQRLHSAGEYEGTGVGLATVQRILHRHGGRVRAEAAVGKGATFFFTVPYEIGERDERERQSMHKEHSAGGGQSR